MDQILENRPLIMISDKESIQDIRELADFLDTKFELPFGWRFGWDGIIGLVPGIGDFVPTMLSFYIVYRAAILGCTLSVILRLGLNILIDNVIDALPILGIFLDFVWKSNDMKITLLDIFLYYPHQTTSACRIVVFTVLALTFLMVISIAVLTFYFARWIWGSFQSAW